LGNIFLGGNLITSRDIDCNGNVQIDSITPSTSTTTGALVVSGGLGILGNIFLGGNLITRRDIDCNGNIQIDSITPSISTTTGALVISGGAGILGNIFLGGNLITRRDIDCNGNIQIDAITPSISTTTGALVVSGGAGILGNIFLGGNLITSTDIECAGNLQIDSITPSISTTTGAIVVAGGAGIVGNIFLGGNLITNGDISCNGNINIRFPINTTYTALPTFTNTQIGCTIPQTARTAAGSTVTLNTAASLANITLPVAGVWLINYTGGVNLGTAAAVGGNVTFGLHPSSATTAPIIGNIRFCFPATALLVASPAFQGTGSYVHSGASTTYYLNYLVTGQSAWSTTLSTMTATRLA